MSNSEEVLKKLGRRCSGRNGWCSRVQGGAHKIASGMVAANAAVFPFKLCKAILQGFRSQLVKDGRLVVGIVGMQRPEETWEAERLSQICTKALNVVIELNAAEN